MGTTFIPHRLLLIKLLLQARGIMYFLHHQLLFSGPLLRLFSVHIQASKVRLHVTSSPHGETNLVSGRLGSIVLFLESADNHAASDTAHHGGNRQSVYVRTYVHTTAA